MVGQVALGRGLLQPKGIDQRAMHQKVRIAADRRGKMRIAAQRQTEVPGIARTIIGLRLAAQHRLHDERLFGLILDRGQHGIEQLGVMTWPSDSLRSKVAR
jgi:hypothetical protein